jgi:hypothetical protein
MLTMVSEFLAGWPMQQAAATPNVALATLILDYLRESRKQDPEQFHDSSVEYAACRVSQTMTEGAGNALIVCIVDCISYRAVRGKLSEHLLSRPCDSDA